jgi:receptor protein-tyrosine kinase
MPKQAFSDQRVLDREAFSRPGGALPGRENEIEFRRLWRRMMRERLLLSMLILVPVGLSFTYICFGPKQFAAVATLEARPVNPQPSGDDVFGKILSDGPVSGLSEVDIATTQVKLQHYDFLARVASDPALQSGMRQRFPEARRNPSRGWAPLHVQIAGYLEKNVKISRVRGTRLLDVVATHRDPDVAALIANRFVQVLISDGLSSREAFSSNKIEGLEQDYRKVEGRLDEAQRRVALYLPSFDVREALREARNEVKLLSGRYGELHPNMKAAVAIVEAHQKGLLGELEKLRNHPMEADYWESAIGADSRDAEVMADQAETRLTGRYETLTSEVAALRSLSESLNVRLNEVRIANSRPDLDLRIAQEAVSEAARQVSPNKKFAVAAGCLAGFFIALLRLVALGNPPSRIGSSEDWSYATSLPLLGLVDTFPRDTASVAVVNAVDGDHPLAEQIRDLRSRLVCPASDESSVLLVTSPLPEEGKSALAAALALSMARIEPSGVVLVEIDLRRPSVHKTLDLPNFVGTSDVLTGKCTLDDGLTVIGDLMVMTGGSSESEALHHLGGPSVTLLVQKLKRRFRYVILDSPPVLSNSDIRLIAPLCDEVLLVVNARTTPVASIHEAELEIESAHGVIRGGILNHVAGGLHQRPWHDRSRVNPVVPSRDPWQRPQPIET